MCVEPTILDSGLVECRYCWQCQKDRVNDLVGRCIAEQTTSTETFAVTLTYDDNKLPDDRKAHAGVLVYKDVQDFLKRLRKQYPTVRYIVAGEYGSKKGRAHWHMILFFYGKAPKLKIETREMWKFWPWGFSYFQKPDYEGLKYVLKYVLKDQDAKTSTGHLAMSKKPPLGFMWFQELAEKHVKQGIAPQTFSYSFPDQFDKNGKRRKFRLRGVMREKYLEQYLRTWEEHHVTPCPYSEIVDEYDQKQIEEPLEFRPSFKPVRYVGGAVEVKQDVAYRDYFNTRCMTGDYKGIPFVAVEMRKGLAVYYAEDDEWLVEEPTAVETILRGAQIKWRGNLRELAERSRNLQDRFLAQACEEDERLHRLLSDFG